MSPMTSPTASTAPTLCALALLAAAALAGCGQKGALYQPEPTEIEVGGEEGADDDAENAEDGGAQP